MREKGPLRGRFYDIFPIVVMCGGFVFAAALVTANILGAARDFSGGYVLALGMMLYKPVASAARNGDRNGDRKP